MTDSEKQVAAEMAVDEIIEDLSDRSGFDAWWDGIDARTKAEIKVSMREAVKRALTEAEG